MELVISDLTATLKIVEIIGSFNLETVSNMARTQMALLREIKSFSDKILILRDEILEEFLVLNSRLKDPVDETLFKDITRNLNEVKFGSLEFMVLNPEEMIKGEIHDKEKVKELCNNLIEIFHQGYRWYFYLSEKYQGELLNGMIL